MFEDSPSQATYVGLDWAGRSERVASACLGVCDLNFVGLNPAGAVFPLDYRTLDNLNLSDPCGEIGFLMLQMKGCNKLNKYDNKQQ